MSNARLTPLIFLLAALGAGTPARAAHPQAAFAVKDGWVTLTLTRDGQPVNAAEVRVLDRQIQVVATGETGSGGLGEFPLPSGPSFLVEITIGGKTADQIRLTREGAGLFPGKVLLTFGLAPCCRVPSRGWAVASGHVPATAPQSDSPSPWLLAAGVAGAVLVPFLIAVPFLFPRRDRAHQPK